MSDHTQYYITASNLRKLIYSAEIRVEGSISDIYRYIYQEIDLNPFLNHQEARSLGKSILFLQKADELLSTMEGLNGASSLRREGFDSPSSFLFVSGPPRYHSDNTCETLSRDFENFEVPAEITDRGPVETKRFREFAKQNRSLIGAGKEDVFLQRLKSTFNLKLPMDRVSIPNSGSRTAPKASTDSAETLAAKIREVIEKIESFKETEEGRETVRKYMYASTKALFNNRSLGNTERELLESKRSLIQYVLEYHVCKYRGGKTTFSEKLLTWYGFEPCGICCEPEIVLPF